MQSNRGEPHKARNLARASCGAKGHAKIRLNCQQILEPWLAWEARQNWRPTTNRSPAFGTLQHCPDRQAGNKESTQEGQQGQKAMTVSVAVRVVRRMSK